jgi:hypothetical protein
MQFHACSPTLCCCCRFQQKIDAMLAPVEVDPEDKSFSAKMKRLRNAATKGMAHDIHDDIKDDQGLQVGLTVGQGRGGGEGVGNK